MGIFSRRRFSLRALLLMTPMAGAVVGFYVGRTQCQVVGFVRYHPIHGNVFYYNPPIRQFGIEKTELLEQLQSRELLTEVLAMHEVANLPIVRKKVDPVGWFGSRLTFNFPNDGDVLKISLPIYTLREDENQG